MPYPVLAALPDLLGARPTAVRPINGWVANRNAIVELAGEPAYVIKVGPAGPLRAEAWACTRVREHGIPAPPATVHEIGGHTVLASRFVVGEPSLDPSVWRELGGAVRKLHSITLPRYGDLVFDQGTNADPRGAHDRWAADREQTLSASHRIVDAGLLRAEQLAQIHTLIAGVDLDHDGPGVLIHRDIKAAHVFGEGGRLTTIIDWDAGLGDPRSDLARASMAGPELFAALADGYGLGTAEAHDLAPTLAGYRMLFNLHALISELDHDGDWFDAYRDNLAADVAILARL